MQFIITTDTQDCIKEGYEFVSFGSNPYSDYLATITYTSEGKTEKHHYSKKANPAYVAAQLVKWGLSAPFLACELQLVNGTESNTRALNFYTLVKEEVLSIETYEVAVAVRVNNEYNSTTEEWDIYTYTPFFLRDSHSSREALVMTLPVGTDYNNLLTSDTVFTYLEQFRLAHEKTLEDEALAAQQVLLAYEQGRTQATNLLVGATFIGLRGNILRFLSADGNEFSVYASMTNYDECALIVGGNEI